VLQRVGDNDVNWGWLVSLLLQCYVVSDLFFFGETKGHYRN